MSTSTKTDLVSLARTLADDTFAHVAEHPTFSTLLDASLLAMELRRTLGQSAAIEPLDALVQALDVLPSEAAAGPWLYRGAAQAGWLAHRLSEHEGTRIGTTAIDALVLESLLDYPDTADIDLPRGLLGLGVYGLWHPLDAYRRRSLEAALDVLERRVEHDRDGVHVSTVPLPERVADGSAGTRMVGVAHGTAGLAAFLATAAVRVPEAAERIRPMLDGAFEWLLARRQDDGHGVFPHRVELPGRARPTWCSGDPGVGTALRLVHAATGDARAAELASHVERMVLARDADDCGVVDACICHGAAGLVWYGTELADRHEGAAALVDRWSAWISDRRTEGRLRYFGPWGMIPDPSFLEGDAGAALALLQAATGVRGTWRQLILASGGADA